MTSLLTLSGALAQALTRSPLADASLPYPADRNVVAYSLAAAGLAVLAALLVAAGVLLSRPRRERQSPGSHARPSVTRDEWLDRLDDVVTRAHSGEIGTDEAMRELAHIARGYASGRLGRDLDAHTLADLRRERRVKGLELLRSTVEALYPPEFADPRSNAHAQDVSVEQAAGWVRAMIERWR